MSFSVISELVCIYDGSIKTAKRIIKDKGAVMKAFTVNTFVRYK